MIAYAEDTKVCSRLNDYRHAAVRQPSPICRRGIGRADPIDEGSGGTTDTGRSYETVGLVSVDAPGMVAEA